MKNAFRLDRNTHLSVIPTLIRWNGNIALIHFTCFNEFFTKLFTGPQRLEGEQLLNPELLSMFFNEE